MPKGSLADYLNLPAKQALEFPNQGSVAEQRGPRLKAHEEIHVTLRPRFSSSHRTEKAHLAGPMS
jgi:hypothetical protein